MVSVSSAAIIEFNQFCHHKTIAWHMLTKKINMCLRYVIAAYILQCRIRAACSMFDYRYTVPGVSIAMVCLYRERKLLMLQASEIDLIISIKLLIYMKYS